MANLTPAQVHDVTAELMRKYSAELREIPVTKVALYTWLLNTVEPELEASEVAIYQATPTGAGKTWLQQHPEIGRDFIITLEQKRLEVL